MRWVPDGGHMNGRKLPVLFAAAFLGLQEIYDTVHEAMKNSILTYVVYYFSFITLLNDASLIPENRFSEDSQLYRNDKGVVLWGQQTSTCSIRGYPT